MLQTNIALYVMHVVNHRCRQTDGQTYRHLEHFIASFQHCTWRFDEKNDSRNQNALVLLKSTAAPQCTTSVSYSRWCKLVRLCPESISELNRFLINWMAIFLVKWQKNNLDLDGICQCPGHQDYNHQLKNCTLYTLGLNFITFISFMISNSRFEVFKKIVWLKI